MDGHGHAHARHIDADQITLPLLQSYYNIPLAELAKELGLSLTLLKKICRKFGIQRWPHRQIRSINKSAQELQERVNAATSAEERADLQAQLNLLEKKKRLVTRGASSGLQSALRNALFLANPEQLQEDAVFDVAAAAAAAAAGAPHPAAPKASNPMHKMMQQMRSAAAMQAAGAGGDILGGPDLMPTTQHDVYGMTHAQTAAASAPSAPAGQSAYGGFGGHHLPQDSVLLLRQQQQMAAHMAQVALQQQMHMNNYMCMPPAPPTPSLDVPMQALGGFPPTARASAQVGAPDFNAPFTEVAALLGMSDEDIAMSVAQSSAATDFDAELMSMVMDLGDVETVAPQQQLPSAMHTGAQGLMAPTPQFHAPPPSVHYMEMGAWGM